MSFRGFRDESFQFFTELAANNSREWFEAHQADYEQNVLEPFRELVVELQPSLKKLNPNFVSEDAVDEHFSRIDNDATNDDTRPPFKTSFYCFFWNNELNRLSDASLYVGLNAEGVTLGFSIYDFSYDAARMGEVFKPRLQSDLGLLDTYIKASYLRRGFDFRRFVRGGGRHGLRTAEPFPGKGTEWSGTLGWVVSRQIKPGSSRLTPGSFVSEVKDTFERLYPLYIFASETRGDWKRKLKAKVRVAKA